MGKLSYNAFLLYLILLVKPIFCTIKCFFTTNIIICDLHIDYSEEDKQLLSIDALLAAHHPLVISENSTLWLKIVRHFKLQPKIIISLHANNIRNKYIAGFQSNQVRYIFDRLKLIYIFYKTK